MPKDQRHAELEKYFSTNPQAKAELESIRQPLTDIQDRCGSNS